MMKYFLTLIFSLVLINAAFAQRDTAVYYLKEPQKLVSTKDSADFFLVILPPDTAVDKELFVVKEYYRSGKIRLAATSTGKRISSLSFQGTYVAFYPNGHRKLIRMYDKGKITGDELEYYPNGKLYHIRTYSQNNEPFLKQYNDSTGTAVGENGKGHWQEFSDDFKLVTAEGAIENGLPIGTWKGNLSDSVKFESVFDKGELISSRNIPNYKPGDKIFTSVEQVPVFPGGIKAFIKFLEANIRYPEIARSHSTQGKVIVTFVVDKDGTLKDIEVVRGIGDGCDEEAIRVMKLSPLWTPGVQNGKPVLVQYSIPIAFELSHGN